MRATGRRPTDELDRPEAGQEPEAPGEMLGSRSKDTFAVNGDHYNGDSCQLTQLKKTVQNLKRKI